MKDLIAQFGWPRLVAIAIALAPLVILPVLGTVWLWQAGGMLWWLLGVALAAASGLLLNKLAVMREQRALDRSTTEPGAHWPGDAEQCWRKVEALADEATPEEWPLSDGAGLMRLARRVLVMVAGHFHPRASQPLLQMTLPHTLLIIERASRELREEVVGTIPFSHRLTLGTVAHARTLRELFRRHEGWIRAARAVVSPQRAVVEELRRAVFGELLEHGSDRVQTWLLREYIRKLGYHAIELYGGLVQLDDSVPLEAPVPRLAGDEAAADARAADTAEPLRILLLGRANAGKSSLINALFGEVTTATDVLPDTTTGIEPFRLDRDGALRALVFDTPGFDGELFDERALERIAREADLLLWVSAANRADRAEERVRLDRLRASLADPARRAPPMLVVMTHIDQLRPMREWDPPYVLDPPQGAKAGQIVAAMARVAADLDVPMAQVIPVCLAEGMTYNVDDALWAAMLLEQPDADRVRLLRCLRARQRDEDWRLLWAQLRSAGRVLASLRASGGTDSR
ncbi:GTPase domain-containing protein [Wenzhouxiangella sp. XN24]|uniref:GTPase family protein n=1 Tax=Wenzhouxiangella sp. XN24 TaxID=2713569 RepID=UPI0013EA43DB|nr:GTPase domain-containing protein [Wenzhouxiangella sp. XN24]NGX14981.1 GTPase domain-containing protein [Wenzhouxiangella sp. XN24]